MNINDEMNEISNFDMRNSMSNTNNSINNRSSYNKTANSQKKHIGINNEPVERKTLERY